jgi:ribosomal L17-like protein
LRVFSKLHDPDVGSKVLTVLRERYMDRHGGYTRMLRAGPRPSDRAPMAVVELVGWKGDLREGMKRLAEGVHKKGSQRKVVA